jgi:hypothetical protein
MGRARLGRKLTEPLPKNSRFLIENAQCGVSMDSKFREAMPMGETEQELEYDGIVGLWE